MCSKAFDGDCSGSTVLTPVKRHRSDIFVETSPHPRVDGDIQLLAEDHPVSKHWQVIANAAEGHVADRHITLFDSVGFAIEGFTTMCVIN